MIQGVEIKNLKVIKDNRGFLMEMLRCDDDIFEKFGQVYLSVCNPNIVKGWHYHKKQTDQDRKSTRLNSSHGTLSRMPSSA